MVVAGSGIVCNPCRLLANGIYANKVAGHSILERYPTLDSKLKVADAFVSTTQIICLCCHLTPKGDLATGTQSASGIAMRICTDCTKDEIWDHSGHCMRESARTSSTHEKMDIFIARSNCQLRLRKLSARPKFLKLRKRNASDNVIKKKKVQSESSLPSHEVQTHYKLESSLLCE